MKLNPKLKENLKKYLMDTIRSEKQRVVVYSSVSLSADEKNLLKQKFSNISFQNAIFRTDESLLAGIVITVGTKIIDLSLKGRILNLQHIVYENS